jgi:hypothetical protein
MNERLQMDENFGISEIAFLSDGGNQPISFGDKMRKGMRKRRK